MKVYHQNKRYWRPGRKFAAPARKERGSQIVEFGASIGIFFACILLPLLDFGIIPVRWLMARELITKATRQISYCETFSQALAKPKLDGALVDDLRRLGGVEVDHLSVTLKISRIPKNAGDSVESITVRAPHEIPQEWLPNGSKAPCTYTIGLEAGLMMSPALVFQAGSLPMPGVNAPILFKINAMREWEHSGRDPVTGKFFINE
ncbi:MAG: hypothetical protein K2W95_34565 [Candidatus Obscuribacterales bacterium]|nr:hypothetical protein [Candidatus Obscuribacterales bacterium]